jgi:thymidylate kinase
MPVQVRQPAPLPSMFRRKMGIKNFLIEGVSGTGKTSVADDGVPVSFFCGGCRNFDHFIDLLDGVFVLKVDDIETIFRRLDERVAIDPTDFGGRPEEKDLVAKLHRTEEDMPRNAIVIDAAAPLDAVVDDILREVARKSLRQ